MGVGDESALNKYLKLEFSLKLIDLLFVQGEPGDDQPFVANNEKVNTNLYLYSVST